MIRHVLAALILVLGVWVAESVAQTPLAEAFIKVADGIYKVQGKNYEGTVAIVKKGQSYHLTWTISGAVHQGIGMQQGGLLASSWPGGVVVYEIQSERNLSGQYPGPDGTLHRETLTFLRPLPVLPPARKWNVGDALLVNWSKDPYWYPATVTKKDGERYFVVFDDGDEEWTSADRMTADDLREGDRIFGNWRKQGQYYAGHITRRKDRNIHIKYDDGDEEDTTIAVVRLIRP